jgi:hypothetical protein
MLVSMLSMLILLLHLSAPWLTPPRVKAKNVLIAVGGTPTKLSIPGAVSEQLCYWHTGVRSYMFHTFAVAQQTIEKSS